MLKYFIPVVFTSFILISCTDDNMSFEIGNGEVDVRTKMAMTDTFTVKSYTVMLDSIRTSDLIVPAIIVGNLHDNHFGTINASSFFRVLIPSGISSSSKPGTYNIKNDAIFDSVSFYMVYNKYYEGDTTLPFELNVHRLKNEMQPNTDGYFYNNDSIGAYPDPIGRTVFIPSPNSGDTVWITLDRAVGLDLFEKVKENNSVLTELDLFLEYFKGLMVRGSENNNSILGFNFPSGGSDNKYAGMRIYYHYFEFTTVKKWFDFRVQSLIEFDDFSSRRMQFNRFTLQNPEISFPVSQKQKLPVSATGDHSYLLAGLGIITRLEIPFLKNLYYINDDIRILDASLQIEPVAGTYTEESLPGSVTLYETDNQNRWVGFIYDKFQNPVTANLSIDMLYQENTRYTFDLTNFMISNLQEETDEIPALHMQISGDEFYRSTKRLIPGSQNHDENKIKLKVYYITVK